jgi:hypothetical protein
MLVASGAILDGCNAKIPVKIVSNTFKGNRGIWSGKNTGDCMKYTIIAFYLPVLFPNLLDITPKLVPHTDVSESWTQVIHIFLTSGFAIWV